MLMIYKNGTAVARTFDYNKVEISQHICINCATTVQLDKDDYVELYVYVYHSGGMYFDNTWGCTVMSIDRLPM